METEDIAVKLEAVDSRSRSNTHRIDALERHQAENDKMLNTIALIAQRQDTMDVDIKEIKTDVKALPQSPHAAGRLLRNILEPVGNITKSSNLADSQERQSIPVTY